MESTVYIICVCYMYVCLCGCTHYACVWGQKVNIGYLSLSLLCFDRKYYWAWSSTIWQTWMLTELPGSASLHIHHRWSYKMDASTPPFYVDAGVKSRLLGFQQTLHLLRHPPTLHWNYFQDHRTNTSVDEWRTEWFAFEIDLLNSSARTLIPRPSAKPESLIHDFISNPEPWGDFQIVW